MDTIWKPGFAPSDSLALQYRRELVARDMAKVYEAFGHRSTHSTQRSMDTAQQPVAPKQEPNQRS